MASPLSFRPYIVPQVERTLLRPAPPPGLDAAFLARAIGVDDGVDASPYLAVWRQMATAAAQPSSPSHATWLASILLRRDPVALTFLLHIQPSALSTLVEICRAQHLDKVLSSCSLWHRAVGPLPTSAHESLLFLQRHARPMDDARLLQGLRLLERTELGASLDRAQARSLDVQWHTLWDVPSVAEVRAARKRAARQRRGLQPTL